VSYLLTASKIYKSRIATIARLSQFTYSHDNRPVKYSFVKAKYERINDTVDNPGWIFTGFSALMWCALLEHFEAVPKQRKHLRTISFALSCFLFSFAFSNVTFYHDLHPPHI